MSEAETETLSALLFDNSGTEVARVLIDNVLKYALESDISLAIVANWINSSLKIAGCKRCVSTHEVIKMINNSKYDGKGTYSMKLPKKFLIPFPQEV